VSVVVTGIAAPFLTFAYGVAQRRFERNDEEEMDLRHLLDSAAAAVSTSIRTSDRITALWKRMVPPDNEAVAPLLDTYAVRMEEAGALGARLAVRLGPDHRLVERYRTTVQALADLEGLYREYQHGVHGGTMLSGISDRLTSHRDQFTEVQRAFLVSAQKVVGPRHVPPIT
jgi:hypothetical protein